MSIVDFAGTASFISGISGAFHGFAHWAAPAAVAGLWQGAAVAAGLAVCLRLAPRVPAAHRFTAWAAGFGVAVGLPALPLLARMAAGLLSGGAPQDAATVAGGAAQAWLEPLIKMDARWSLAIAGLWLGMSAYRASGLALHSLRLRRLWMSARPVDDERLASFAAGVLEGRSVEICTTPELDRPSVIGFFAPRILIPEWLLGRLTHEELEQVILHEAEHLRRRDDWTNLAQKLCLAAFPLNPALVWMDRRLSKEREMACDEGVVRATGAPRAYAACLASLAERGLEHKIANRRTREFARRAEALSLGVFERRPELVQRVHSILLGGKMLNPAAGRALVGVVGCGLLLGSVELARCPQMVEFVQEPGAAPVAAKMIPDEAGHAVRAVYTAARGDEGFHAVNTVAMVPARVDRPASPGPQPERAETVPAADMASAEPHEVLLKARVPGGVMAKRAAQPQEWLVVTTWQVQTTFKAQNVADYDDGTPANDAEAADAVSGQGGETQAAGGMAVARMFLGVYRASQTAQEVNSTNDKAGEAAGKTARPAADRTGLKSLSNQPAVQPLRAVPFGDGWLVFQL